eukprot:3152473-Prymnesium_polylepis.1
MDSFGCCPRPPRAVVVVDMFSDHGRFSEPRVVGKTVTPCVMSVMPSLVARRAARRMSCH